MQSIAGDYKHQIADSQWNSRYLTYKFLTLYAVYLPFLPHPRQRHERLQTRSLLVQRILTIAGTPLDKSMLEQLPRTKIMPTKSSRLFCFRYLRISIQADAPVPSSRPLSTSNERGDWPLELPETLTLSWSLTCT